MKRNLMFSFLVLSFLSFCACDASVNRSIHVGDGERSAGLTSVNGSIRVGSNCTIEGNCRTVNGRIEIGDGSRVEELDTVNGRIVIGANVEVDGDAGTVNGSIECGAGSKVRGKVSTVNGRVELRNAAVSDEVSTVNGDVLLSDKSVVRGGIVIKGRRGHFSSHDRLEIRVEGGSIVEGGIDVRDPERKVKVYVDKDSKVNGEIRNAEVVRE
ncbi:MAG: hypothetical protein MUC72_10850 [Acidobacteria bacterium]|jgi:DUF4097 and DUF4098 domain-containing protein YvlB|nr:hypothetical protein [Acidobacteriota bacterium]